ncbi:SRPBCC domain-containing protein [Wukongibacter sp. M2B1]|uniref:SRPBCC domain-containing protein n=1 Tax=Wukongibacter sp. M2B1 TaxID=3088895 RepID=UPI003D7B1E03
MAYAKTTVLINRPISEVFEFILNGENNKLWRPTVVDIKRNSDKLTSVGVGTVFLQGMKGPNGMRINADYEIIECDRDKNISFQVLNGPYRALGIFKFESHDKGSMVTFSMSEATSITEEPDRTRHLQRVVDSLTNLKKYFELEM